MKVELTLTIQLDVPIEEIGRSRLKEYVRTAVRRYKGSFPPEDEMHGLGDVYVSSVRDILTPQEMKARGGKARAMALSADERSEIARKAARARWAKKKEILNAV